MNKLIVLFLLLLVPPIASCKDGEKNLSISVVSIAKAKGWNLPGSEICRSFKLSKSDVVKYFSTAEEVDSYEFNRDAVIFPCKYAGTILINGKLYRWTLSAGGAGYLYIDKVEDRRFLCKSRCSNALPEMAQ